MWLLNLIKLLLPRRGKAKIIKIIIRIFPMLRFTKLKVFNHLIMVDLLDNVALGLFLNNGEVKSELEIFSLLDKIINKEDVFYDIGANIGYYTLFLADRCRIYTFEPNVILLERLGDVIRDNKMISVFPVALSNNNDYINFFSVKYSSNLSSLRKIKTKNIVRVQVYRLDSVIQKFQLKPPSVMKIDVEGYEYFILEGYLFLNEHRPIIIFEWSEVFGKELNITFQDLLSVFDENWKIFRFENNGYLRSTEIEKPLTTNNLLAIHKDDQRYSIISSFERRNIFI